MSETFWAYTQNSLWDYLFLGGVLWPGICLIQCDKSRSVDPAKEKGKDGVTLTDNGFDASPVKATLMLWTQAQWDELNQIMPNFDPRKPGGSRSPLEIWHPALELLSIQSVYLRKISVSTPTGDILRVDLDMIEWFPETKIAKGTTGTAKKAKGFQGADKAGAPLNPDDFKVTSPSSNTAQKL
jgi:hypothetical protein